jgi:hypothetical protein
MKHQIYIVCLFSLVLGLVLPAEMYAQDVPSGAKQSDDLVHSAEFIRKKLDELLAAMSDVAGLLEKTDPEAAKILRQTVIYAQQEDVVNKIDEVKKLLRKGLDQAAEASQAEIIGDLTHMLRLLEGAQSDLTETDERLAELRAMRNRLETLLKRQQAEEARTRAVKAKDQIEKDAKALVETLRNLIRRQEALREETGKLSEASKAVKTLGELHRAVEKLAQTQQRLNESAAKAGLARLPVLAEGQRKLLQQAKQAVQKLADAGKDEAFTKAQSRIQAAVKPMQQSAAALEASNQAKAAAPGTEAQRKLAAAEKTLAEAIQALVEKTPAGQLAESQKKLSDDAGELKHAAQAVAKQAGLDETKLPASNLPRACRHMNRAADALKHQERAPAQDSQAEALKALRNELARAEELRRKALGRAQAKLDATEQNEITKDIGETAETMKKARDGKPMPGQPSAAKAGQCSGKAGECLAQEQAAQANQRQNETRDHLRDAMKTLDEQIEKLERLSKAEKLASISQRLEKVLDRQKACTKQTRVVYDARAKTDPPYDRAAQQKLAELAGVEGDLSAEVQSIRAMLKKEGTTVVFPAVLDDVRRDLADVQTWLSQFDPGPLTQATQDEIEHTLEELLESVRKELSKGPGRGKGGGGGGQCKCKPPLIPPIAELRMLRLKQLRVNRNTKRVATLTREGKLPEPQAKTEHEKLARRQEQVLKLVREMREKLKKENQTIRPVPTPEDQP